MTNTLRVLTRSRSKQARSEALYLDLFSSSWVSETILLPTSHQKKKGSFRPSFTSEKCCLRLYIHLWVSLVYSPRRGQTD